MDFRSQLSAFQNNNNSNNKRGEAGGGGGGEGGGGGGNDNHNYTQDRNRRPWGNNSNRNFGRSGGGGRYYNDINRGGGGGSSRGGYYYNDTDTATTEDRNRRRTRPSEWGNNNNNNNNNPYSSGAAAAGGGPPNSKRRFLLHQGQSPPFSSDPDALGDLRGYGYRIPKGFPNPPSLPTKEMKKKSTHHIALLAITIDDLPYEHIWKGWCEETLLKQQRLEDDNDTDNQGTDDQDDEYYISLLCHAKYPNKVQSTWLQQRLLTHPAKPGRGNSFEDPIYLTRSPAWGSVEIVRAMLDLVQEGLSIGYSTHVDPRFCPNRFVIRTPPNVVLTSTKQQQQDDIIGGETQIPPPVDHFLFISETCIPVTTAWECFSKIENGTNNNTIDMDDISWINACHRREENIPKNKYEDDQFANIHRRIPGQYRWKADQWILLSRKHATEIMDIDHPHIPHKYRLWQYFRDINASDEMYFPTALALLGYLRYTKDGDDTQRSRGAIIPFPTTTTTTTGTTMTSSSSSSNSTMQQGVGVPPPPPPPKQNQQILLMQKQPSGMSSQPTSVPNNTAASTTNTPTATQGNVHDNNNNDDDNNGNDDNNNPNQQKKMKKNTNEYILLQPVTYTDWSMGMKHPTTFYQGTSDLKRIGKLARNHQCLMARKFAPTLPQHHPHHHHHHHHAWGDDDHEKNNEDNEIETTTKERSNGDISFVEWLTVIKELQQEEEEEKAQQQRRQQNKDKTDAK